MTTTIPITELEPPERVKGCCQPVAPPLPGDQATDLATLFTALGDPTRIQMIHILAAATDPVCVCDFTAAFELGQPTISHHLAKLREAGLVTSFRRGLWAFYQLKPDMTVEARHAIQLIP